MIKSSVISILRSLGFVLKQWENTKILDKNYHVIKGSVRTRHDKDDAWLFALGREHHLIFDIGCNIGQASLMLLYHNSVERIFLVDPNPAALSIAAENLIQNNFSMKAHFINAFISEKCDDTVDFYTDASGAAGSRYRGFAKTAAKKNSHYPVKTLTIDYLSEFYKVVPGLIKVDVEGAERELLKGAVKVAAKGQSIFFVEMHSGPELSILENTQGILDWCQNNSYKAWYLKSKSPLDLDAIKSRGRYHALLLPAGMNFPDSLRTINENDFLK